MQPNKTLFFTIIGLAVIVVVGMFVAVFLFWGDTPALPTMPGETTIRVVAAPSIKDWASAAAAEFNRTNSQTQVEIISADNLIPEEQFKVTATQGDPPAAWLAEATFVVEMAGERGLQFEANPRPVASSSLAWGAFTDKLTQFTQKYGELSWQTVHAKAVAPGDFLTLVIASPANRAEGLAALASATAAHLGQSTITSNDVDQARPWLSETLRDNTRIPPRPAEAFASSQGRSIGDMGLLSRVAWQNNGLDKRTDFSLTLAQPDVQLDYPVAIWTGSQSSPAGQQAAAQFRDFLLSANQQQALANFGLEPAAALTTTVKVDGSAGWALLRFAEQELNR